MGAILTGSEIKLAVQNGSIEIDPFDERNLGPNSYDIHTGADYSYYEIDSRLDTIHLDRPDTYKSVNRPIPPGGVEVIPGEIILISTMEHFKTEEYVPMLTGRSSIGRLGISVHQEAGFGDIGFSGKWTLCITTVYPVIIKPGMRIGQVYFLTAQGSKDILYHGRYQGASTSMSSLFNK